MHSAKSRKGVTVREVEFPGIELETQTGERFRPRLEIIGFWLTGEPASNPLFALTSEESHGEFVDVRTVRCSKRARRRLEALGFMVPPMVEEGVRHDAA
jgi:hypothetical protein